MIAPGERALRVGRESRGRAWASLWAFLSPFSFAKEKGPPPGRRPVRAGRPRGERTPRRETKSKEPLNNSLCSVPTRCISRNLPLVKMISAQNSHYLSAFLLLFLKKGRLPPVSGYGEFSPGHGKRIQIGTSEHGVQSVLVFLQTTIHGFPVAELTLDDPERVLYFAAHR